MNCQFVIVCLCLVAYAYSAETVEAKPQHESSVLTKAGFKWMRFGRHGNQFMPVVALTESFDNVDGLVDDEDIKVERRAAAQNNWMRLG